MLAGVNPVSISRLEVMHLVKTFVTLAGILLKTFDVGISSGE